MQQFGRKDRRGRLAMRSADGNAVRGIDERGQHFPAAANRHLVGNCRAKFRFVGRHGRRDNQFVGIRQMRRIVSDRHRDAAAFQPFRAGRGVLVATRYPIAALFQQIGYAGHAYASNAEEVQAWPKAGRGTGLVRESHGVRL